jgi:hypothetical protein
VVPYRGFIGIAQRDGERDCWQRLVFEKVLDLLPRLTTPHKPDFFWQIVHELFFENVNSVTKPAEIW